MAHTHVCPSWMSWLLLLGRSIFHDPQKLLDGMIKEGDIAADIGCGPGFFTAEMSRLAGASGKVYAADLQQAMLDRAKKRISKMNLPGNIIYLKTGETSLNIPDKLDFVLLFYVAHEVPDKAKLFAELGSLLKKGGKVVFGEPKNHETDKGFAESLALAEKNGFKVTEGRKAYRSYSAVLTRV